MERLVINTSSILENNWLGGFTAAEGNFDVKIHKSKHKVGFKVILRFRITQHERELKLIELLIKYLGFDKIDKYASQPTVCLTITKLAMIKKINQLFNNNQLQTVLKLMIEGFHQIKEGLDLIRKKKEFFF